MSKLPIKKETVVKKESTSTPSSSGEATNGEKYTVKDGWQDIPLKCTSDNDKDIRYHILKFQSKRNVDIKENFSKPVRMHRKDPRNIQFHLSRQELDKRRREEAEAKAAKENGQGAGDGENSGKGEDESKDETMEADMSQVAPDGGARKSKRSLFKRKTRQINLMDDEKRKLRYEEYYPWVIEDYDGANVFVGNYEAGSSDTQHVLFVFDKDGFKMVPAEKVYRFTQRNKYATLTLEEAEAKMEKNSSVPRWLMRHMEENSHQEGTTDLRFKRNATPAGENGSSLAQNRRHLRVVLGGATSNDRDSDHDDIDFDEEFADDEEAPIIDGDEEENKLSEQKIKKEMMKAAHFDGQSDAEADDDDLNDLFETEKSRKVDNEGKKLRKVLNKTEGGVYDSDDDDNLNPYLSKSDLESLEDSDDGIEVKRENDDSLPSSENQKSTKRMFFAYNVGDGFVVVKAPHQFLNGLPHGDWNPNGRKRTGFAQDNLNKKLRAENGSPITVKISTGRENERSVSPSLPGSPVNTNFDLTTAGPENILVTRNEVLDIVRMHPLTTKELLIKLKTRVNSHPDNKQRIIAIVKQNLKLFEGKLVLKD